MREGKIQKLEKIMNELVGTGSSFTSCVVTNERGLVVAEESIEDYATQTLAAMISLLSDTAVRVSTNLGYHHPTILSIKGLDASIAVHEFIVQGRWFRIGAILTKNNQSKKWFFRRNFNPKKMESKLAEGARKLCLILED